MGRASSVRRRGSARSASILWRMKPCVLTWAWAPPANSVERALSVAGQAQAQAQAEFLLSDGVKLIQAHTHGGGQESVAQSFGDAACGRTSSSQAKIHSTKVFHVLAGLSLQLLILFEKAALASLPPTWTSAARCAVARPKRACQQPFGPTFPPPRKPSACHHNFDKLLRRRGPWRQPSAPVNFGLACQRPRC